jgi:hypothetical protein
MMNNDLDVQMFCLRTDRVGNCNVSGRKRYSNAVKGSAEKFCEMVSKFIFSPRFQIPASLPMV